MTIKTEIQYCTYNIDYYNYNVDYLSAKHLNGWKILFADEIIESAK